MRVLRVNEKQCPRCGRGVDSGYQYPDCHDTRAHGMTQDEAHGVFCSDFADDICAECYRERRIARSYRGVL